MYLGKTNRGASGHHGCADTTESARRRGEDWARLLLGVLAVAVIWLVVLPWIQRFPAVDRRIRLLENKRIDASALYYTDLEVMHDIYKLSADGCEVRNEPNGER